MRPPAIPQAMPNKPPDEVSTLQRSSDLTIVPSSGIRFGILTNEGDGDAFFLWEPALSNKSKFPVTCEDYWPICWDWGSNNPRWTGSCVTFQELVQWWRCGSWSACLWIWMIVQEPIKTFEVDNSAEILEYLDDNLELEQVIRLLQISQLLR